VQNNFFLSSFSTEVEKKKKEIISWNITIGVD
jgi:hypothetical protein